MKYPWETWNLVPNQLAAGTLSTLRWEPCLHQRRLSWLCNQKILKGNCMMIIMVILEFFCKYRWKQTFGSHSSGTEAVGNKSDGGRSTECWSGFCFENFWGPLFMGPCWLSFQCPECSLYSIAPLAFTSGGHYWTDRDGFGGHGIYGFHQTFIPAFNSTMARVEKPDSEGRRIESQ